MMEDKRALAHIEKIEWVKPIEGADNIELIGVLGWVCIAKRGEFQSGDLAVYIEIDSKCPDSDGRFEFLAAKHYKVKTMKLGKFHVISQGLALPLEEFPELNGKVIGTDVTDDLKITYSSEDDLKRKTTAIDPDAKYKAMSRRRPELFKKPIVRKIMRYTIGKRLMFLLFGRKKDNPKKFPDWIVRTDETRIENAPFYLGMKEPFIVTEKLDGTSCTFAVNRLKKGKDKFEFIVCSRNVRQADRNQECYHESNIYWELADKYNIESILTHFAKVNKYDKVVLQGEGIGYVQGNPYKLKSNSLYIFNLIVDGVRFGTEEMADFCWKHELHSVPIVAKVNKLPNEMEDMKLNAEGFSVINPKVKREGLVYRSVDGRKSFKNVSREYLLKHNG